MDTTIDQQMAMDEALVPTAQRLKIGRSNFCLLSDIKSKESTLQLVYDVLRICPFFKAFLEFWATATVHYHSIRFKMDNKKHIVNLESFRDILHICPRVHAKASKAKSLSALSEVAMIEAQQVKLVTKRSMQQTHISQPSGLGTDEGTGSKPGVLDVPTEESEEELSWNSTNDEDDDGEEGNGDDDDQEVGMDDDKDDDEEGRDDEQEYDEEEEEYAEETRDGESFDPIP
nr:hypothetical protein [Tanacetum cinerariifolium]